MCVKVQAEVDISRFSEKKISSCLEVFNGQMMFHPRRMDCFDPFGEAYVCPLKTSKPGEIFFSEKRDTSASA